MLRRVEIVMIGLRYDDDSAAWVSFGNCYQGASNGFFRSNDPLALSLGYHLEQLLTR